MEARLAEAYAHLGLDFLRRGGQRDRDAIIALTRSLDMKPRAPERIYYARAVAHEMIGDMRAAFADYEAAASVSPDWPAPQEQLRRLHALRPPSARSLPPEG